MPSNDCCGHPQLGYEAGHSVLVDRETERISTHTHETWPSSCNHDLWQRPSLPRGLSHPVFLHSFSFVFHHWGAYHTIHVHSQKLGLWTSHLVLLIRVGMPWTFWEPIPFFLLVLSVPSFVPAPHLGWWVDAQGSTCFFQFLKPGADNGGVSPHGSCYAQVFSSFDGNSSLSCQEAPHPFLSCLLHVVTKPFQAICVGKLVSQLPHLALGEGKPHIWNSSIRPASWASSSVKKISSSDMQLKSRLD